MFQNTDAVKAALAQHNYIATDAIATVVFLAQQLGKPLLLEGPAGVGKTELAKVYATATNRELIRLQCYEGLDESKALYEWEYAKQMLYTQLLRDKLQVILKDANTLTEAADRLAVEAPHTLQLGFGDGRAVGRDDLGDTGPVEGDDVHIAFDHDQAPRLPAGGSA